MLCNVKDFLVKFTIYIRNKSGSAIILSNLVIRFVCLLFYVLATSKVISGWVPTCDSAHSWRLYGAAPLEDQAISTMTWYPTQSHDPDIKPTSLCLIPIMPSTWPRSSMHTFLNHWLDSTKVFESTKGRDVAQAVEHCAVKVWIILHCRCICSWDYFPFTTGPSKAVVCFVLSVGKWPGAVYWKE